MQDGVEGLGNWEVERRARAGPLWAIFTWRCFQLELFSRLCGYGHLVLLIPIPVFKLLEFEYCPTSSLLLSLQFPLYSSELGMAWAFKKWSQSCTRCIPWIVTVSRTLVQVKIVMWSAVAQPFGKGYGFLEITKWSYLVIDACHT